MASLKKKLEIREIRKSFLIRSRETRMLRGRLYSRLSILNRRDRRRKVDKRKGVYCFL